MRKQGKRFERNRCTVNPLFALDAHARNRLALTERVAMDAILDHKATADHIAEITTLIEASVRAVLITKEQALPHLDGSALDATLQAFYRAARALINARRRHETTGVYGLDAEDRAALIQIDQLVGDMRKPGVILRKTWLQALRDAYKGAGIKIPTEATV